MRFLSRENKAPERTSVQLYLNRPMMPTDRHQFEDRFVTPLLEQVAPGSTVVGGGTFMADEGGPLASDFALELPTDALPEALESMVNALHDNGTARGSYLEIDGRRFPVGEDELVLLHTGAPWANSDDMNRLVRAVQTDALRDGQVGWHEGAFPDGNDHTVLVLSGPSAGEILAAVRAELPHHPAFPAARVRSISPGAPESDPLH